MERLIQLTEDGSYTLFIPEMDEHYHSVHGAIQESLHVFINAGFRQLEKKKLCILEIGFGTGLNAFLTLLETLDEPLLTVTYYAIERFPLELDLVRRLNYGKDKRDLFLKLHKLPWNTMLPVTTRFNIYKAQGDSNTVLLPDNLDLTYFDAFAPDKQPEMWNQDIFDKLYVHTSPGGILTTYCAKGSVRRMMQKAGYSVERIPGPPGKREMLRAKK